MKVTSHKPMWPRLGLMWNRTTTGGRQLYVGLIWREVLIQLPGKQAK